MIIELRCSKKIIKDLFSPTAIRKDTAVRWKMRLEVNRGPAADTIAFWNYAMSPKTEFNRRICMGLKFMDPLVKMICKKGWKRPQQTSILARRKWSTSVFINTLTFVVKRWVFRLYLRGNDSKIRELKSVRFIRN